MTRVRNIGWSPLAGLAFPLAVALAPERAALARPAPEALLLPAPPLARVQGVNRIDGLTVDEQDDGTTMLRLRGAAKPTFNVYRLSGPDRLVVDIAGSERGKVVPHVQLDTWTCGRVVLDDVEERGAKLVRVVVELKREVSYIVVPDGNNLAVTVTPREIPPEAYFARKSAGKRRAEIERDAHTAAQAKATAQSLKAEADAMNKAATVRVREAETRAQRAERRAVEAKQIEARAAEVETSARAALQAAKKDRAQVKVELERAAAERQQAHAVRLAAEQALAKAKTEADAERERARIAQRRAEAAIAGAQATKVATEREVALAKAEAEAARSKAQQAKQEAERALAKAKSEIEAAQRATRMTQAQGERALADARAEAARAKREASRVQQEAEQALARAQASVQTAKLEAAEVREAAAKAEQQAREDVARARAEATEARRNAESTRARAEQTLASAEQALAEATRDRQRAAETRMQAERALAAAKKNDGEGEAARRRALVAAKSVEQAARERQAKVERELADLRRDRDALRDKLSETSAQSRKLESVVATREREIAALQKGVEQARARVAANAPVTGETVARARSEAEALQGRKAALEAEVEALRRSERSARRSAEAARSELAKLERRGAQAKVADARTAAKSADGAHRALEAQLQARTKKLAALDRDLATHRRAIEDLEQRRKRLASQGDDLQRKNTAAKRELEQAEAKLAKVQSSLRQETGRLDDLQADVERARQELRRRVNAVAKGEAAPVPEAKAAATKIESVRFESLPEEVRVVIEHSGPVRLRDDAGAPGRQQLTLSHATIPSALQRSLDASAYRGPVHSISSFEDGDDVKIVVTTQDAAARPELEQRPGVLVWKFPRTRAGGDEVVSMAGARVGGFRSAPIHAAAAAPAADSGSGDRRSRWRGQRIQIELQQSPIKDVLLLFSDIGNTNIIAGRGVEGIVTMKLTGVPWDQALDIILRSLNLGMVREGNVIRVATLEDLEDERRKAIERAAAQVQLKPLETRLIPVSYATVTEMLAKVQSVLSSRGSVVPDSRTNTLIVMDVAENIALAEQLVGQLDSQTPQVLIEARIVEARTSFLRQLGIQWGFGFTASPATGNPTGLLFPNSIGVGGGATGQPSDTRGLLLPPAAGQGGNPNYAVDLPAPVGTGAGGALGFTFGSINGTLNTNLRLSAAEDTGEVRIISAPKIVTLDNTQAQIEQGVQIPISQVSAQGVNTRYVNATLALRVTPHVTNEGAVLMDVTVQKNEADFINTGARGDPTILTKQATSRMLVNDADTAVIGGIYTRNKSVNSKKVPWIADIPIIGWFFKNRSEADTRTEVLIFLTPKIVNRATSIGG